MSRVVIDEGALSALFHGPVARDLARRAVRVESRARELCPVRYGRLKASITWRFQGEAVIVGTNVEYAAYVEFGTSRMRAQPYLRPALEAAR